MPALWSLIDARGPDPQGLDATTRLAGLSLIARHVRMSARQGWAGAVVRAADDAAASAIARALERHAPPARFAVEVVIGDAAPPGERSYVPLTLMAVYTPDALAAAAASLTEPSPAVRIETRADLRTAEALLYARIRKSIDQDGIVSYYLFRPLSRRMTRSIVGTSISPNHVSLVAMSFGVAAAVCAALGGTAVILAGLFYWIGAVIDCVDGEVARLRLQGSRLGEWLDTLSDDVSTFGLLAGLGIGMMRDGVGAPWPHLAVGASVVGALVHSKLYADLHRMHKPIDTAQYPWFFGTPFDGAGTGSGTGGFLSRCFYVISFLFRRDAYVTITMALLLLGARHLAVLVLGAGIAVILVMFLIHHAVMASGRAVRSDES